MTAASKRRGPGAWRYPLCLAGALLIAKASLAGFNINEARTRLVDGVYLLDAQITFDFSEESLEALANGVALTVIVEMDIVQSRPLVWDKRLARLSSRHQLQRHALSNRYVLTNLNTGESRSFRTLRGAMRALGTLERFPMLDSHLLHADNDYTLRLRARLDIEALPAPLRPLAYLSELWRKSDKWSTWPIER